MTAGAETTAADNTADLPVDFAAELGVVDRHTQALLATTRSLDPGSLGHPSLCPGWTRGHILTHVARNADALLTLVRNATTGASAPMYASAEARTADIEAGAARPLEEQLADVESSAARLAAGAARLTPDLADVRLVARGGVTVRAGYLPFMRLREVVLHHVDLDAGYGFADIDAEVTVRLLEDTVRRLRRDPQTPSLSIRTDEGDVWSVGDGRPVASGSRAAILGWLSRGQTRGVVGDLPTLPSLG